MTLSDEQLGGLSVRMSFLLPPRAAGRGELPGIARDDQRPFSFSGVCDLGGNGQNAAYSSASRAGGLHADLATDGVEPIRHVGQAGTLGRGGDIESRAVILDLDQQFTVPLTETDHRPGGVRVLLDVLERFETAEVDSCFRLLRVPADAVGVNLHGDGRLARL